MLGYPKDVEDLTIGIKLLISIKLLLELIED